MTSTQEFPSRSMDSKLIVRTRRRRVCVKYLVDVLNSCGHMWHKNFSFTPKFSRPRWARYSSNVCCKIDNWAFHDHVPQNVNFQRLGGQAFSNPCLVCARERSQLIFSDAMPGLLKFLAQSPPLIWRDGTPLEFFWPGTWEVWQFASIPLHLSTWHWVILSRVG